MKATSKPETASCISSVGSHKNQRYGYLVIIFIYASTARECKHMSVSSSDLLRVDIEHYSINKCECEYDAFTSSILLLAHECNVALNWYHNIATINNATTAVRNVAAL